MTVAMERGGGTQFARVRSGEEKIYVTVRVRPLSSKEVARSDVSDWVCTNHNTIAYKHALPDRSPFPATYTLDRVFGPECQTQRVYEEGAKDVALSALTGLNSTIFAYGQTSSGKTFTMRGVTESAIADIFEYIQCNPDREFVLKVAALEIYNEVVKDLLASDSAPLRLLDDKEKGTIVDKLREEVVRDVNHLREVIKICEAQRQVGETSLNDTSSRSHQIIRLTVESHPSGVAPGAPATSLVASLNFVDLAGSERASQTHADGARLKEGAHINRSLLTLSTCIRKLSGGSKKSGHVPYRDSKLTRILQHSLGGNARTAIICTMSPAHSHVEQSRNTLAFATRAKEVTNTTHINMVVSDKVLVKQLQKEVARLEAELKVPDLASEAASSEALLQAKDLQIQKMEEELRELQIQRDAAQARLDEVSRKLEAEEVAKKLAEEEAKRLVEEAAKRPPSTPGPQSTICTPLSVSTNRRRWSDSGDYLIRKLEGQNQQPQTPPSTIRPKGPSMSIRQSTAASVMLVQEIRKLENLQDELGEDANRALEALQKEVECLRLAQAGMNHDAASTIKKLQDEIHTMHSLRSSTTKFKGLESKEDVKTLRQSISMNHVTLRQELSRLGDKDKTDADAAIATLEEQLESVQRSLDKMILANEANSPKDPAAESPKTPARKKNVPLTPAGMARQRLTENTPCSPAARRSLRYANNENNENTPPRAPRDINPHHGGEHATPRGNGHQKQGASPAKSDVTTSQTKESPGGGHKRSNSVDIRKMQNLFKTAAEDNIKSIRSYVTELKERVAKLQYQKQLLVCQVLELEASGNDEEEEGDDDLNDDELALEPMQSPGSWKIQFEQQRALIFELWDTCNVSIIHRTQFYLLFKGDPADGIYMEVELRRLTWLQENFNAEAQAIQSNANTVEEHLIPASPNVSNSAKSLKRERELLARQMHRRLTNEEREELFIRWGVPLDGKQRKLQLVYKLWMDPHNLGHIQASAEIVARIVGIINPGSAPKEMFALNFAPPNHAERPHMFGWNGLSALLNF
ncbi:hypothetical protein M758_2G098300 [Ceratodon purpureus]|uniref:Kinesin motor domain-containing protein n=1 Tax=Ceratodon purpureus TaxID=3225 RepID=A0A8T0IT07_CERPU|nr:hypothetical protein KC19_2G068500 [Ceratodon purpureus]KAG0626046.1 hypothetical protein M758_2G098300 [Ceratodon purpureus]